MKRNGAMLASLRRWPRGWRLVIFSIALVVTVVLVVPAFIMGIGYLVGFGACDNPNSAALICSPIGRLLLTVVLIGIGLPLAVTWARFLARTLAFTDDDPGALDTAVNQNLPRSHASPLLKLSFGERLLSGTVESRGRSSHHVVFEGDTLTFWSIYAFQKGWLKETDQTILVYQTVPFLTNLKLALAFWSGPDSSVRGVAAGAQSASVLIAAASIPILTSLKPHFSSFFVILAVLLIIVDALYLALMMRAKSALREFINREARI
jgi:hypothetical protein